MAEAVEGSQGKYIRKLKDSKTGHGNKMSNMRQHNNNNLLI